MYTKALETSANAAGTLQEQQDIFMESTTAHLQRLSTEAEKTYDILFDQEAINGFSDALTGLLSIFNTFLKGLGGGMNDFVYLGAVISNILNKQIAGGINNFIQNFEIVKNNKATIDMLRAINEEGFSTVGGANEKYVTDATSAQFERLEKILSLQNFIDEEEFNKLTTLNQEITYYDEIINLKQQEIESGESSVDILRNQTNELKRQNLELERRASSAKSGKLTKKDLNSLISQGIFNNAENNKIQAIMNESSGKLTTDQQNRILKEIEKSQMRISGVLVNKNKLLKKETEIQETTLYQAEQEREIRERIYKESTREDNRKAKIGELVNGLSSLVQVGTVLSGVTKTLNDETLSAGEKISQIVMVVPSLAIGFSMLTKSLSSIALQFKVLTPAVYETAAANGTLATTT